MTRYELQVKVADRWVCSDFDLVLPLSDKKLYAKMSGNYQLVKIVTTTTVLYPKKGRKK